MNKWLKLSLLNSVLLTILVGCSTVDSQAVFTSAAPRKTADLSTPPGLTKPDLNTKYKMGASYQEDSYQLDNVNGMKIVSGGSERWLVIESTNVSKVWPMLTSYFGQLGLTIKYQNPAVGVIQSDWAARNNNVPQGNSLRGLFAWIGMGSMYSLDSMYMYRATIWQDGNNVVIMDTNYQMDEEYLGCSSPGISNTSTLASSDSQQTKWIPRPSNPQLELEFLTQFMVFAGLPEPEVKKIAAKAEAEPKNATVADNQVIVNDQLERAWWRTGLALDRIGLGIIDKNRSLGEYYVYPLKSQEENPDPSFLQSWFGSESKNAQSTPKPLYTVKLLNLNNNQTAITIKLFDNSSVDKNFNKNQQQYLSNLAKQLQ